MADDQVLVIAERYTSAVMADSTLRAKLKVAFNLEYNVRDKGIDDGILGKALDRAIEEMLPFAKRHSAGPGWYGNAMTGEGVSEAS